MTIPGVTLRRRTIEAAPSAAVIASIGCGVLAARPALLSRFEHPATALALVFGILFVLGVTLPLPHGARSDGHAPRLFVLATAIGVLAFLVGRVAMGGHGLTPATFAAIVANSLAALAEEVWFRRLCFGLFAPVGSGFAIVATTVLFALVHVSTYGFTVLPLDLAAGLLLGWQRSVTGSWAAPAITHVVANLFMLL